MGSARSRHQTHDPGTSEPANRAAEAVCEYIRDVRSSSRRFDCLADLNEQRQEGDGQQRAAQPEPRKAEGKSKTDRTVRQHVAEEVRNGEP
jgi:hypothetical protein